MSKKSETTEGKLLNIDLFNIDIIPKYNVRRVFGDINELADEILVKGITSPGMVKENPDKPGHYLLIRGHRHYKAAHLNVKNKLCKTVIFPCTLVPEEWDEVDLILDLETSNNGLNLNLLEKSDLVWRLTDHGLSVDQIAEKMRKSVTFVRNCLILHDAPNHLKEMIVESKISSTLLISMFKKEKDYHVITEKIEEMNSAIEEIEGPDSDEEGETTTTTTTTNSKKITKKDVEKQEEVQNSVSFMKKILSQRDTRIIRKDNLETFLFLEKLFDGEYSKETLEELFFEPDQMTGN